MVELIVIVAVIAILGGILTPMVLKEIGKSKITRAGADMEAVSIAFTQYYADTGYWPEKYNGSKNAKTTFRNFASLYTNTKKLPGWDGPYIEKSAIKGGKQLVANKVSGVWEGLVDPWGKPFQIIYGKVGGATASGGIALISAGPNGKYDTSSTNALKGIVSGDDVTEVLTSRVSQ